MKNTQYMWEFSKFDTEIFGFNTAKISFLADSAESVIKLLEDLKINKIVYATYRINAARLFTVQLLEKNKFILVDGVISLEKSLAGYINYVPQNIRQAKLSDSFKLEAIGESVFFGVSRYYNDPIIPVIKANEIYKKWVENSVKKEAADMTLVYEENNEILGFATCKNDGQIPLIGVKKNAQGKGIGKTLISAMLKEFKEMGLEKAVIETQMTNIPALKLYLSCGFKPSNSYLTLRWHFQEE